MVKATRKEMGVTQRRLALTSGTDLRFIIELENGEATCPQGKVLTVLDTFEAVFAGWNGANADMYIGDL